MHRRSRQTPLLLAGCAAALAGSVRAQAPPPAPGTPEAAARRSMQALKEARLPDFAAAMHPEALDAFRGMLLQVVEGATREGKQAEVMPLFAGVSDAEGLKKLSPAEFYVSFIQGAMNRDPDLKKTLAGANYRFLGHVVEGPTAHVVYRFSVRFDGKQDIVMPGVISVKKHGDDWAALLTGDIEGMAQALSRQFDGKSKPEDVLKQLDTAKSTPSVLGLVPDGKERAYAVVRWVTTLGEAKVSKMSAHEFRPKDAGWKFVVKGDRAGLQRLLEKDFAPL